MSNYILTSNGELYHYGVPGMKWGVRRQKLKAAKQRYKKRENAAFAEYERTINKIEKPYKRGQNLSDADYKREEAADKKYQLAAAKAKADYKSERKAIKAGSKKSNPKQQSKKTNTDKEDIQRMINALDQHQKAMTMSTLNSASGMALRSAGQDRTATLMNEVGNWQVSRLSASSGYDFWR